MGYALRTVISSPASSLPETSLIRAAFATAQPCVRAHSSTANTPLTSVAVVTAAAPPVTRAISRASAFAPPRCPDASGMANCPLSSTAITAGSLVLLARCGATARTAMPAAPTYTSARAVGKCDAVQSFSLTPSRVQAASPPSAARSFSASARPRSVKERYAISPPSLPRRYAVVNAGS